MIDVITLAILKKYIDSSGGGGSITPEEIQEAVNNYLNEHPVQPTPLDTTLTIEGYAADAKAVGDAIQKIYDYLESADYIETSDLDRVSNEDIENLF